MGTIGSFVNSLLPNALTQQALSFPDISLVNAGLPLHQDYSKFLSSLSQLLTCFLMIKHPNPSKFLAHLLLFLLHVTQKLLTVPFVFLCPIPCPGLKGTHTIALPFPAFIFSSQLLPPNWFFYICIYIFVPLLITHIIYIIHITNTSYLSFVFWLCLWCFFFASLLCFFTMQKFLFKY